MNSKLLLYIRLFQIIRCLSRVHRRTDRNRRGSNAKTHRRGSTTRRVGNVSKENYKNWSLEPGAAAAHHTSTTITAALTTAVSASIQPTVFRDRCSLAAMERRLLFHRRPHTIYITFSNICRPKTI